tara:strand:+ start:252 stop:881 length:630 start_codon:yes stop_codon:yes gene_type:complete
MSKPGKSLKALCKRLKVRLTVKRGKKRVYKSVAVLKRQCVNKKKKVKKKRKVKKKVKRRRKFGTALVGPNNIPPLGIGVTIDDKVYHFDERDLGSSEDGRRMIERIYTRGNFNNGELESGDIYIYDSYAEPADISDNDPVYCYRFKHLEKEAEQDEEEEERFEIRHDLNPNYTATFNPVFTHFEDKIRAAHLRRIRTNSHIGKRRKKRT